MLKAKSLRINIFCFPAILSLRFPNKKNHSNRISFFMYDYSSYYKVVVFIVPLQGLYAILLEILWIV